MSDILIHFIAMTTTSNIERHDLLLPNKEDIGKLAFVLLNVFTPEECQQWIDLSEERGYSPALINSGAQQTLRTDIRNNSRCMIDDVDMAQVIFERIKSYLPNEFNNCQLIGLNERLRFLRYDPGEKFVKHLGKKQNTSSTLIFSNEFFIFIDGQYYREDGSFERSYIVRFKIFIFNDSFFFNFIRLYNFI